MQGFFRGVPATLGAAFVIVTHLSRKHKSLLPDVLARFTPLEVEAATDGVLVQPNRVYVMPAGFVMGIEGGRLTLTPLGPRARESKPIDIFLTALAVDQGERAVAVILSGGDGDGAIGVKAIKEHGGLTLAQTLDGYGPETPDMPLSSLRTGFVDFGETAERMGGRIAAHSAAVLDAQANPVARELDAELLTEIFAILRSQVGHDFSGYKPSTFVRRLRRRIGVVGAAGPGNYLELLRADPAEVGGAVPGPADRCDEFLPRHRCLRGSGHPRHPEAVRGARCDRCRAHLGCRPARPARRSTRWPSSCASTC